MCPNAHPSGQIVHVIVTVPFVFQEYCHVYISLGQYWRSSWEDFSADCISHWKVTASCLFSIISFGPSCLFFVCSFIHLFVPFSSSLKLEGFDMAGEGAHAFTAE